MASESEEPKRFSLITDEPADEVMVANPHGAYVEYAEYCSALTAAQEKLKDYVRIDTAVRPTWAEDDMRGYAEMLEQRLAVLSMPTTQGEIEADIDAIACRCPWNYVDYEAVVRVKAALTAAREELGREKLKCSFMHGDVEGLVQHYRDQFLRMREERDQLRKNLKDPATVHSNILRGDIALTKAQAIHIAGLRRESLVEAQNRILRLMEERDLLLFAIAPADYAKIEAQLAAISESSDKPEGEK